jgi:hypothetical protein
MWRRQVDPEGPSGWRSSMGPNAWSARAGIQGLGRAHRLFAELPGGAPVKKSTTQYKRLLGTVRPRDQVGRTRRRLIADELAELARIEAQLKALKAELADELAELARIEAQLKALKAELAAAVCARGSHLMDLPGIGPAGAARILADVGDVARFPARRISRPGPAPPRSTPPPASRCATGCPGPGTGGLGSRHPAPAHRGVKMQRPTGRTVLTPTSAGAP